MKEVISEFILHETIFLIVLITLYFFVLAPLNQYAILKDIYYAMDQFMNIIRQDLGSTGILPPLSEIMDLSSIEASQATVDAQNKVILKPFLIAFPIVCVILFAIAYFLARSHFLEIFVDVLWTIPFIFLAEFIIVGIFIYSNVSFDLFSITSIFATVTSEFKSTCNYMTNYIRSIVPVYAWSIAGLSW
jgi:hypothetical protein